MSQILLVDDDLNFNRALCEALKNEGYGVVSAKSFKEGLSCLNEKFDLIVLDWMLTDGQGIDLLKVIRAQNPRVPIIFLTARVELVDKVLGLEMGANDYITKPFEIREFLARVRVQLRTQSLNQVERDSTNEMELRLGDLCLNSETFEAFYQNQKIDLTKKEFDLLKLLAQSPHKVFSRDEILNKVWGYDIFPTTRTVDTHILQIRQKTRDDLIETIRNVGYRLFINN